jgi:hypothetical protein
MRLRREALTETTPPPAFSQVLPTRPTGRVLGTSGCHAKHPWAAHLHLRPDVAERTIGFATYEWADGAGVQRLLRGESNTRRPCHETDAPIDQQPSRRDPQGCRIAAALQ